MEEQKDFYYRINLRSEDGKRVRDFIHKGVEARRATEKLARMLGAVAWTEEPHTLFPGTGIGSLMFDTPQSGHRYKYIGQRKGNVGEYIPNHTHAKGKEIIRHISQLPRISGEDVVKAFGLTGEEKTTPAWFVKGSLVYAHTHYELSAGFRPITEEAFRLALARIKGAGEGDA